MQSHSKFSPHFFKLPTSGRRLAYSEVGDAHSAHVLLCLPGLLENRASFDPLLEAAQSRQGLRVLSLDLCGRGDAEPLPGDRGYCMSQYLQDTLELIRAVILPAGPPMPKLSLLGTSMGGILSMYLAQQTQLSVRALLLNDVGLSLHWMSIYGLYGAMKKGGLMHQPQTLAQQFNVSEGAIQAVQHPSHFDLPYKKSWKGMQFASVLQDFSGAVRLVHGGDSGVCLHEQVIELAHRFPKAQTLEVAGAQHPVPFTPEVCAFLLKGLGAVATQPPPRGAPDALVSDATVQAALPEVIHLPGPVVQATQAPAFTTAAPTVPPPVPKDDHRQSHALALPDEVQTAHSTAASPAAPVSSSDAPSSLEATPLNATHQGVRPRTGFWAWLRQRLGAKER